MPSQYGPIQLTYSAQNNQPGSHIYNPLANPLFGNPESWLLRRRSYSSLPLPSPPSPCGEVGAASSLAPKIGLLGLSPKKGALKEPQRDRKKTKNIKRDGSISLDDVVEIARVMRPRLDLHDLVC
ncbi:unnamed protein product [Musa acuminata subsp. malaccensis]|uniref:(wild Malaysian banana) hypothetical protein n=1 Tax=Musa acuminata subsp. malaccensis TaxID=214687 RepID=A0A804KZF8_MUSAM|nr:unnamed protein product [Musa acuminata subsp. malaccensis]